MLMKGERARVGAASSDSVAVLPSLVALSILFLLLVGYWREHRRRAAQRGPQRSVRADKLDTTLNDFRDMREALRPLANARVASRREPQGR
jgi:hypothetical protein